MIWIDTVFTILKVALGILIFAELAKRNYQEAAFLSLLLVIVVFLIK